MPSDTGSQCMRPSWICNSVLIPGVRYATKSKRSSLFLSICLPNSQTLPEKTTGGRIPTPSCPSGKYSCRADLTPLIRTSWLHAFALSTTFFVQDSMPCYIRPTYISLGPSSRIPRYATKQIPDCLLFVLCPRYRNALKLGCRSKVESGWYMRQTSVDRRVCVAIPLLTGSLHYSIGDDVGLSVICVRTRKTSDAR